MKRSISDSDGSCRVCGNSNDGRQQLFVPEGCGYKAKHFVHQACALRETEFEVRETLSRYPHVRSRCAECFREYRVLLRRAKDFIWNRDRYKIRREYPAVVSFLGGFQNYSGTGTYFDNDFESIAFENVRPQLPRFQRVHWNNDQLDGKEFVLDRTSKRFHFILAPEQAMSSLVRVETSLLIALSDEQILRLFGDSNVALKSIENVFTPHYNDASLRLLFRRICSCENEKDHDEVFWDHLMKCSSKPQTDESDQKTLRDHRVSILMEVSIAINISKKSKAIDQYSPKKTQAVAWAIVPTALNDSAKKSEDDLPRATSTNSAVRKFVGISAALIETDVTSLRRGLQLLIIAAVN